ncbi:hypothetical protein PF005_g12570 [Phytophthora fragariae]|nr:hypothetical protein PF005_g12570 [Phytophthora fragariae]KAE9231009.1 hypothetical protein PF002_g12816 [Phytophthora fragariae]
MYIQSKALTEKIVDRLALQTTPTFSVAYKWLEDFYEALNNGQVVDFARSNTASFPGLSRVASFGAATLSQTSFADPETQLDTSTQASEVPPMQPASQSGSRSRDNNDNDGAAASPVASLPISKVSSRAVAQKDTENTPNRTESNEVSEGRPQWKFAERPLVHGMTKAQRRDEKKKEERLLARDLAEKYRTGKVTTPAKLEDVARLLDGPYSLFRANPMAETLMLPFVNVQGKAQIQLFSVGQSIPSVKAIPQLEQVMEVICAMELRPKGLELLAYWPGYSSLTKDQLENMRIVYEANKQFVLVMKTSAWMETVEWTIKDLCTPFNDTNAVTKSEFKGFIETLNLGVNKFENEEVEGYKLLDFRENLWLHSTSILMALFTLRDEYSRVGIVDPSYHHFAEMAQKRSVASGLGAADPKYERVLGIINVGSHWVAFMIDKNAKLSHMFDPLQSERNYTAIERSVRKVMDHVLDLEGKLGYKKIDWCEQQDGSSCGIWCIAVLEMLVVGATWNDKIYRLQPYLRMRYLYKVISLLMKPAAWE